MQHVPSYPGNRSSKSYPERFLSSFKSLSKEGDYQSAIDTLNKVSNQQKDNCFRKLFDSLNEASKERMQIYILLINDGYSDRVIEYLDENLFIFQPEERGELMEMINKKNPEYCTT